MSWLRFLIPFAAGAVKGFVEECSRPAQNAVLDYGRVDGCNFMWVAVRPSHAAAFRRAYPKAYTLEAFHVTLKNMKRTNPAGYRYITPFAESVIEAMDAHPDCEIFVMLAE